MSHDSQIREFVIFVNYRRSDSGWPADRLTDKLKSTFGEALVFLDTRDIAAGNDFSSEIEDHLQRASVLIVLIGKDWLRVQDRFGRRRLEDPGRGFPRPRRRQGSTPSPVHRLPSRRPPRPLTAIAVSN